MSAAECSMDSDMDVHAPSLIVLDPFCLVHISQFLVNPRDLASLQCSCKALFYLLQSNNVWTEVLALNHGGIRLQLAPAVAAVSAAAASSSSGRGPSRLQLPNKALCSLLEKSSEEELHSVRFVAVYTDGGVDTGTLQYWADHAFIPNSWAPFCAKYSENVNLLAFLKTGPEATGELSHRQMMVDCLKWVLPVLQQNPMPLNPETFPVEPTQLAEAAEMLSAWKTQRLESFFCQMAARAAARDPLGLSMLRGLPAPAEAAAAEREARPMDPVRAAEETRQAAAALGQDIARRSWYDRAYRLKFFQPPPQQQQQQTGALPRHQQQHMGGGREPHPIQWLPPHGGGAGGRAGGGAGRARGVDSPCVLDEAAVRSDLMTPEAASHVAILHGLAVSREGRLSCPVQSGALVAGMLPPDWPAGALAAVPATATPQPQAAGTAAASAPVSVSAYELVMRSCVEQPSVTALNDKLDAESVFAACAAGQLPPWVRHVVMEHAEFIELLPPHLEAALGGPGGVGAAVRPGCGQAAGGTGGGVAAGSATRSSSWGPPMAGIPKLHPVIWFRFTEHAEYSRRRLSSRARSLLRHVSELNRDAAELLEGAADQLLETLRAEATAWAEAAGAADRAFYRPTSLSTCLHRAIRLSDRLTSLATAMAVLAPELRESAGFGVGAAGGDGDGSGLLAAATAMKAALGQVAARLAAMEEFGRAAAQQMAAARVAATRRERQRQGEDGAEEGVEGMEVDGEEQEEKGSAVATLGRWTEGWLGSSLAAEATALARALEGEALGSEEGRRARRQLAAALRRQQAAAIAASEVQSSAPGVVERRNEELLARLPVRVPPPVPLTPAPSAPPPPAAAAAVAAAAASPPRDSAAVPSGGAAPAPPPVAAEPAATPLAPEAPAFEPPPPAGWAADRMFDAALQHDVDAGRVVLPEADEDGHRVLHLAARLLFPVAANAVVFKAIRPENLMTMVGWDENEAPNVDVQYIGLQGRVVRLPPGVQAVPGV